MIASGPAVVIVEDHPMLVDAEEALLTQEGFQVTGTANSGTEAIRMIAEQGPDVVVLDLELADVDGLDLLHEIVTRHPETRVVVYSGTPSKERVDEALEAGAAAFVRKAGNPADLVSAIYQVTGARSMFFPSAARRPNRPERPPAPAVLTKREVDILTLVAKGATNAAVANKLAVSEQTVKFHLSNIFRKIGVANRTAATRWAETRGLLSGRLPEARSPHGSADAVIRLADRHAGGDPGRRAEGPDDSSA